MDQTEIGAFIARERRAKKLTQRQLADALGISDKTVSKWECGNGLPEVSLMLPLCAALELSVNELLSGERLDEEQYRRRAEENMMDLIREREENKRRFWLTFVSGMSALALFVMLFALISYSDWISPLIKTLLCAAGLICFFGALVAVMEGERTKLETCKNITFTETTVQIRSALNAESTAQIEALAEELCRS